MVLPMTMLKMASLWTLRCLKSARKFIHNFPCMISPTSLPQNSNPNIYENNSSSHNESKGGQESLLCDFEGTLLRSQSLFPYFMLVAFEGGNLLRAMLLLISFPFLWVLGEHSDIGLKTMIFISFCGLRTKDIDLVARVVLPKFYLENLNLQAYEMVCSNTSEHCRRVVVTSLPRVMVEWFLREYLEVSEVVGVELEVSNCGYFNGFVSFGSSISSMKEKSLRGVIGDTQVDVALVSPFNADDHHHIFVTYSKKTIMVDTNKTSTTMPRNKYPKPLIFHDGRLAFLPNPSSMLALFLWLPMGSLLSPFRLLIGHFPYTMAYIIAALTGLRFRANLRTRTQLEPNNKTGVLYVCNHRTLLDPIMLTSALKRPVPAVVYSLSKMSEILSPINTVRLTRDRTTDASIIRNLLSRGDLIVCPEGTTCREPYLLRFSPLFAELSDDIVPVAMSVSVEMFYGTTVSGHKWLDPVVFLMNPMPVYAVRVMEKVPPEMTCGGGRSAMEVAIWVQRVIGEELGFECTSLTRKDKYMMLVGNEGRVKK